jgi:hypothetical protein
MSPVKHGDISTTHGLHHLPDSADRERRDEQMDVVGHQYIGMDLTRVSIGSHLQAVPKKRIVARGCENGAAVVSALNDVERKAGYRKAWQAWHVPSKEVYGYGSAADAPIVHPFVARRTKNRFWV